LEDTLKYHTTTRSRGESTHTTGARTDRHLGAVSDPLAHPPTVAAGGPLGTGPWLVDPTEAAELLSISRSTIYTLMAHPDAQQRLPSVTLNRCRRIPVEALRAWLAEQLA